MMAMNFGELGAPPLPKGERAGVWGLRHFLTSAGAPSPRPSPLRGEGEEEQVAQPEPESRGM
jgi:hypothetical protein